MEVVAVRTEAPVAIRDNLEELTARFLASQDVSPGSRKSYEKWLRQFAEWATREQLRDPSREDILRYKDHHLAGRDLSAFTISAYMVAVRKFFEWAEGMKLYPNVARGIKGRKKPKGFRKDPLTNRRADKRAALVRGPGYPSGQAGLCPPQSSGKDRPQDH